MNLEYTPEQRAFRLEVRAWLEANLPAGPLASFDLTREGFEAHRDWERKLNDGRWGMATLEVCLAIVQSANERKEIRMTRQVPMPDDSVAAVAKA